MCVCTVHEQTSSSVSRHQRMLNYFWVLVFKPISARYIYHSVPPGDGSLTTYLNVGSFESICYQFFSCANWKLKERLFDLCFYYKSRNGIYLIDVLTRIVSHDNVATWFLWIVDTTHYIAIFETRNRERKGDHNTKFGAFRFPRLCFSDSYWIYFIETFS